MICKIKLYVVYLSTRCQKGLSEDGVCAAAVDGAVTSLVCLDVAHCFAVFVATATKAGGF